MGMIRKNFCPFFLGVAWLTIGDLKSMEVVVEFSVYVNF